MRHQEFEIFLLFSTFKMASYEKGFEATPKDHIRKYFACYIILQLF